MKRIRNLFTFILLLFLLAGCAQTFQPPAACEEGSSVILKVTDNNPTGVDKALLTVNFIGLERGKYTAEQAEDFLNKVADKAKSGIAYLDFVNWLDIEIQRINRYVGVSMIVLGDSVLEVGLIGNDSLISACDKQLILAHIDNQLTLVGLYK